MSCVMYKLEDLPDRFQSILKYNPMVHILNGYRDAFMYHRFPDWTVLGGLALVSIVGIVVGAGLIGRFDSIYAKRIVR